jgi:hypothetical protein
MKLDRIILTMVVTIFLAAMAHQALAQNSVINDQSDRAEAAADTSKKNKKTNTKKAIKKKTTNKVVRKKTTRKTVAKKAAASKVNNEDLEIQKEIRALERQASAGYVPQTSYKSTVASTSRQIPANSAVAAGAYGESVEIRAEQDQVSGVTKNNFSGGVNLSYGNDNNVDPDRIGVEGRFVQLEPKIAFKEGGFSADASAMIRDFADQQKSDIYKQNEGRANLGYQLKFNDTVTSTTTLGFLYHDERWPNYVEGPNLNGRDTGYPIRYFDSSIGQKFGFDLGMVALEAGGKYKHRDALSEYTDYTKDYFLEEPYEKDFDEFTAHGKATLRAASFLDVSLSPMVQQTKFTEREGRLPSGHYGGILNRTPLYELITSEIALDLDFKFGKTTITPRAFVGQVSDEALGAEDQSYYGYGIAANIMVYEPLKFTISPYANYKEMDYDNWTSESTDALGQPIFIAGGDTRLEDEIMAGISASIMATENFGLGLSYAYIEENSNLEFDPSENYRQEIIMSTLIVEF